MTSSPPGSRINRSPSPALPPPPSSAGLPPRPAASTTSHVGFSRQSLGPSSAVATSHINPPGSARNFSGPARSTIGGGRPVSEILGGGGHGIQHHAGGGPDPKSPEAEAIDRWFQDLASYEVTLEEMAAASLDQNFTEELSAIEQWFRVLSEAERTAALYSLLQHSTQVQIRFFMTVLQQMARSDPMSALLSPATGVGGSMQAQMEAKLAGLSLRSPNNRTSFGAPSHSSKRDSFGGAAVQEQYLTPESALANAGEGPAAPNNNNNNNNASPPSPAAAKTTTTAANNKASNRISAPGTLNSLNHSWMGGPQLDQVLERGPSPSGESVSSARSGNNHHDAAAAARPKSTDFTGLANGPPGSAAVAAFARSPRLGEENSAGGLFPLSPAPGNWANMVNTPAVPMFQTNHSTIQEQAQAQAAAYGGGPVPKLSEAPKRRTSGKSTSSAQGQAGNNIYNEHGELAHSGQNQPGRGLQSPGLVGGGFQGPGAGTWGGVRSPSLGGLDGGFGASANNFGLGVGGLGAGLGLGGGIGGFGAVSPSPSDIAFQMSQLQLQQLQLQQLQQLQQLGVAGAGGLGMGLPGGGLLGGGGAGGGGGYGGGGASGGGGGYGGLGMGSAPRNSSSSTHRGMSLGGGGIGGGKRSPMLSVSGGGGRSPSLGGLRRESGAGGSGSVAAATEEDTDIRVLEDVPQWLRTLRLHKYTTNFENHKWRDMVVMTDADLEANGVAALGARRKLLKTFESVRAQMGIPEPTGSGTSANKDTPDAAAAKDGASAAGAAAEDEE